MAQTTLGISKNLSNYIDLYGVSQSKILKDLAEKTKELPNNDMQASSLVTSFISQMIHALKAKNILEIGTYTGYSTLAFAESIPEDGLVVTCEIDEKITEIGSPFWLTANVDHKINLIIGSALDTLRDLEEDFFDVVFIDADKENYDQYYEESLRLLKKNGMICIDNVLFRGEVTDVHSTDSRVKAIHSLNKKISKDIRVISCILPISDGLTIVLKK